MSVGVVSLIIFGALVLLLLIGVPIAFSLLTVSAVGIFFLWGPRGLMALYNSAYGEGTSFLLLAIPLFVLMANVLKFSDLADEL
ncbi:MAG: TRAP transporter large permease subunit, partial [Deltaproteobacteria bacterium]